MSKRRQPPSVPPASDEPAPLSAVTAPAPPPAQEVTDSDWVTVSTACQMFPSRTPGKRLNKRSVWRWILKGKIEHAKNALGWTFVRKSQILALITPAAVRMNEQKAADEVRRRSNAKTEAILARYGM